MLSSASAIDGSNDLCTRFSSNLDQHHPSGNRHNTNDFAERAGSFEEDKPQQGRNQLITRILRHPKLASVPPPIAPARLRQEIFAFDEAHASVGL